MSEPPVITIDGPSGSGKGTLAAVLAARLGWHYLDSGALYRILALAAIERGLALEDEASVAELARRLDIEFQPNPAAASGSGDGVGVIVSGVDRSAEIRSEAVSADASRVAVLPAVRSAVLDLQRGFRRPPGLVTDGRDMGTVVFPEAALKVFLEATPQERAQRRYKQLKDKGFDGNLNDLVASIRERDERDRARAVSPLRPASDAIVIDSTGMTVEEVVAAVWGFLVARGLAEE